MHNLREIMWQVQGVERGIGGEKSRSVADGKEPVSQRGERQRWGESSVWGSHKKSIPPKPLPEES